MSDVIPYESTEIVRKEPKPVERRKLAAAFAKALKHTAYNVHTGKKQSYQTIIPLMVLEALASHQINFIDGTVLVIDDPKDWIDLLRFFANHLDGPATNETLNLIANQNIFKVYAGFDVDKV